MAASRNRHPFAPASEAKESEADEWQLLLDQELNRLPDKYRVPIVLCDLEGKTHREAARQLGWPEGTLSTRLVRGRRRLARRLARLGLTVSAGAMALALSAQSASASVPRQLLASTMQAASLVAAGRAVSAGAIPAHVAALSEGVLKAMLLTKLKTIALVALIVSVTGLGLGLARTELLAQPQPQVQPPASQRQEPARFDRIEVHLKNDGKLPVGPAPAQALARVNKEGQLLVTTSQHYYQPVSAVRADGTQVTAYQLCCQLTTFTFPLEDVQAYDTKLRALDRRDLAKLLAEETVVLTCAEKPDPLHLRVIKEGTLLLQLPASLQQLHPAAMPATPPVRYP
jgi:hypothetical protein